MPARVASCRNHPPALGEGEHPGQDPRCLVGRRGGVAQLVVKRRDVGGRDILERLRPQGGQDVVLQGHPVVLGRVRLAPDRDMVLEAACGEVGDGGLRRRFRGLRILAPLDAVDDNSRLAPALIDRLGADRPQGHPLQAGRPPGLDDVELAPGGVDPYPEAGEVAVPEDGILVLGLQPFHNPFGQSERTPLRHRFSPGLDRPERRSSNRIRATSTRGRFETKPGGNARGRRPVRAENCTSEQRVIILRSPNVDVWRGLDRSPYHTGTSPGMTTIGRGMVGATRGRALRACRPGPPLTVSPAVSGYALNPRGR